MFCVPLFLFLTPPAVFFALLYPCSWRPSLCSWCPYLSAFGVTLCVLGAPLFVFLAPLSLCSLCPSLSQSSWRPSLCSWRPSRSVLCAPLSLRVLGAPLCVLGAPLLEEMTETLLYRGRCYKTNET